MKGNLFAKYNMLRIIAFDLGVATCYTVTYKVYLDLVHPICGRPSVHGFTYYGLYSYYRGSGESVGVEPIATKQAC